MAYRSDLEAALARLDAMGADEPCPACARRARIMARLHFFVCDVFCATFIVLTIVGGAVVILLALLSMIPFSYDIH
jgi:hypothetical protein